MVVVALGPRDDAGDAADHRRPTLVIAGEGGRSRRPRKLGHNRPRVQLGDEPRAERLRNPWLLLLLPNPAVRPVRRIAEAPHVGVPAVRVVAWPVRRDAVPRRLLARPPRHLDAVRVDVEVAGAGANVRRAGRHAGHGADGLVVAREAGGRLTRRAGDVGGGLGGRGHHEGVDLELGVLPLAHLGLGAARLGAGDGGDDLVEVADDDEGDDDDEDEEGHGAGDDAG